MDAILMGQSWLPVAFAALLGIAILAYVILDGYDLGVGILTASAADEAHKDRMVASIGPFWDANETWLVLAVGLLLVAFPFAQGIVLQALYLPVLVMLVGLILRGVAFDFRAKVVPERKIWWDRAFFAGSLVAALAQGYMLGLYITGFERSAANVAFAILTSVCVAAGYAFIGATWLILKCEGALQILAVRWARGTLWLAALGLLAVSVVTPLVSERIFEKWFTFPYVVLLAPVPLVTIGLVFLLALVLGTLPAKGDRFAWVPFAGAIALFTLAFYGLAYSFFPYVVPDTMTIWQAAASDESLIIIFVGALVVLPVIAGYTALSYVIFGGKATDLRYD
ncbi:cytochrome d ubiquinol oxidase subunit II [Salinarimonas sp.]|uniref:cytochrome d ubiquinol oxidase subunit II n=1 Tax=Salinarimonas sp. TaxID=2766526 RepID=UPI00391A17FE